MKKKKITNKTNFYTLYAQSLDTHMRNIFICGITAKEAQEGNIRSNKHMFLLTLPYFNIQRIQGNMYEQRSFL